ncbi:hypothetical protein ACFW9I_29005 [[Kitasatospora] papulosa]|uniref:hypothetical protein n=1 Tax=[Kitasatospora] papulosa TaxID=1464011 RepID=UPI00368BC03A
MNRAAVARATVVVPAPVAFERAAGQPAYGALASMGALNSVIAVAAVAMLSGMISTIGTVASTSGLSLLLNTVIIGNSTSPVTGGRPRP